MSRPVEIGSLKEGMYVVIDGEPSRVVTIEKSKPGKHGSAKVRLVAIGVFDGVKRSIVSP
ncbi:MAG: translation initiation factor IF-5A, partial [Candidatus Bathyarchaeia archaeon]